MSTIWRISASRPKTGSIFPALAFAVKSSQNFAMKLSPPSAAAPAFEAGASGRTIEVSLDSRAIFAKSLSRFSRFIAENDCA